MGSHDTDEPHGSGTTQEETGATQHETGTTQHETGTTQEETGMTPEEKRRDQLLSAPDAVESDADPRIDVTHRDGVTRIDIREDADVRPGNPFDEPRD